jgi:hypothetical protein
LELLAARTGHHAILSCREMVVPGNSGRGEPPGANHVTRVTGMSGWRHVVTRVTGVGA